MRHERLFRLTWLALLALPLLAWAGPVLEPSFSSSDNYGETYSFTVDLEDGTFLSAQFSVTNVGPGSRHGICRATVVRPGRKTWAPSTRVGGGDWGYDKATNTLKVGACTLHTGNGTHVTLPLDGGLIRIVFEEPLTPKTPPNAEVELGNTRYIHQVLVPFSAVKVTLQLPGATAPLMLTGGGYSDHSHSTVVPAKLARSWVRFRSLRGPENLLLLGREGHDGEYGPVYLWSVGGEPRNLESFELRRLDDGKTKAAQWEAEVSGEGGPWMLRSTSLLLRSAPVQDLGVLGSLVKSVVGSPVTYVMRAVLERPGHPAVEGLMEVTLDEG
ncbi:hypothetical protein [Stigmatella aurantiaca]|uniref:Conserved uncharacterized protein n=1 Tax=Stigmatella aurantiaca (strain DW4/3-1) TaxID=378806 RepID=Q092C4_STIAD|nr:hypothetical protein [Stigmatella aurantiaca]ADO75740.1 conserved uncharacterized protein [Stigmatella aurantiaca DW4/3-1]EAU66584.1 hypothetical protein STIAU_3426 [Stigmatella aurantiaca DW4/3-1]